MKNRLTQALERFSKAMLAPLSYLSAAGLLLAGEAMTTDFSRKNLPPCAGHLFGTDWMGRDMLARTLTGLDGIR